MQEEMDSLQDRKVWDLADLPPDCIPVKERWFMLWKNRLWGGNLETCQATSGYAMFLGNEIVSWLSRQQHNIILSSTEAEYVGMTEAFKQISWIQNLLSEMRFKIKSILLLVDNQGAMFLASNPAQEGHTKHMYRDSRTLYPRMHPKRKGQTFLYSY